MISTILVRALALPHNMRFNLVIEKLLISTRENCESQHGERKFQSRNRETFDFNAATIADMTEAQLTVSIS